MPARDVVRALVDVVSAASFDASLGVLLAARWLLGLAASVV